MPILGFKRCGKGCPCQLCKREKEVAELAQKIMAANPRIGQLLVVIDEDPLFDVVDLELLREFCKLNDQAN